MSEPIYAGVMTNPGLMSATLPLSPACHLLQACRSGDELAWQQLLAQYARWVYSVPLHYGLSRDEAADVVQIVFTALLQSLDTWRADSNLVNWLTLVARRHSWRTLRVRSQPVETALAAVPPAIPNPYTSEITLAVLPPTVYDLLLQRFSAYAHYRQPASFIQHRQATLLLDSLQQPLAAGLRAGTYETTRQYLYALDLADVTLNIQPCWQGVQLDLIGQILPNHIDLGADTFVVQLVQQGQEVAISQADAIGSFWFESLVPGSYALLLSTDTLEIELSSLALEA
jgi:DNA-directed RNA polymerase specialized sigma24 family protein